MSNKYKYLLDEDMEDVVEQFQKIPHRSKKFEEDGAEFRKSFKKQKPRRPKHIEEPEL